MVGGAAGRVVLEQVITRRRSRRVYPEARFEVDESLYDFFRRQMESWLQEEDTTWQQVLLRYHYDIMTGDVLESYFWGSTCLFKCKSASKHFPS